MKQILILLTVNFLSITLHAQKLWKVYKPVRSNMVGSSVNRYDSRWKDLALNPFNHSFEISTSEGSNNDFDEFRKRSAIDVIGFISNNIKVQTIDAKGNIYIDQIKNPTKFVPDVKYIYAGLRSDSVTVTLEKTANKEVKLDELISAAKAIGLKLDSTIINTDWADSIKFNSSRRASFTIKNPNVYYSLQFATMTPGRISSKWIKTFNEGTPNNQQEITLTFESGKDRSREIFPAGGNQQIRMWLAIDKDETNNNALFLKSSDGDNIKLDRNTLGGTEWFYSLKPVKVYESGSNKYKVVMLDLEAKSTANGGILITESRIRYPDAKFKVLKRL
jgi:hypothetical protein